MDWIPFPHVSAVCQELAQSYEEQFKKARQAFLAAKDQDVCPLRMLESMHTVLLRTASETGTPLIDARKLLENRSSEGIPGKKVLLDHVHPTIEAHQWIAPIPSAHVKFHPWYSSIRKRMRELSIVMSAQKRDTF